MKELPPWTFHVKVGRLRQTEEYKCGFISLLLLYGKIFFKELIIICGDLNGRKYFCFLILLAKVSRFDSGACLTDLICKGSFV